MVDARGSAAPGGSVRAYLAGCFQEGLKCASGLIYKPKANLALHSCKGKLALLPAAQYPCGAHHRVMPEELFDRIIKLTCLPSHPSFGSTGVTYEDKRQAFWACQTDHDWSGRNRDRVSGSRS